MCRAERNATPSLPQFVAATREEWFSFFRQSQESPPPPLPPSASPPPQFKRSRIRRGELSFRQAAVAGALHLGWEPNGFDDGPTAVTGSGDIPRIQHGIWTYSPNEQQPNSLLQGYSSKIWWFQMSMQKRRTCLHKRRQEKGTFSVELKGKRSFKFHRGALRY